MAIDLPKWNFTEGGEDALDISAVCMSVETIKFIYDRLYKNIGEIQSTNDNLGKYLNRVQFMLDNQKSINFFEPTEDRFIVEQLWKESPPTKDEFAMGSHYIVLQDISVKESKKEEFLSEKWQQSIHKLLTEIDLTAYYNKQKQSETLEATYEIELQELMYQVYNNPSGFLVPVQKTVRIKLLAYFLISYIEATGEKEMKANLEKLKGVYVKQIAVTLDKQQRVEHNLRMAMSATSSKVSGIKENVARNFGETISGIYAGRFMKNLIFAYDIKKEYPIDPKTKKPIVTT